MKKLLFLWFFTLVWHAQAQRSDFKAVSFDKADRMAMEYQGEELDNLPLLAHKLTHNLETDVERFRAIYTWVCQNIQSDFMLMRNNNNKHYKYQANSEGFDKWHEEHKKFVIARLLKEKQTLCSGYTFLIKELAGLAGLECEIVDGFGKVGKTALKNMKLPNHSWNAVKLNNKWYLCDATWSSGYIDGDTYLFKFNYNDAYFLMDPNLFAEEHRPLDDKWSLEKASTFSVTASSNR